MSAPSRKMVKFPELLKQSLTWDRGTEMAARQNFLVGTNMDVYFCNLSSPWQRGTNGLLRQYFPKDSCLPGYSQAELNEIAGHLNTRPRKTLGFITPAYKLDQVLQWLTESITANFRGDYHSIYCNKRDELWTKSHSNAAKRFSYLPTCYKPKTQIN